MKAVILDSDDWIDGQPCVAGQLVCVPDDYANVRRTVATAERMRERAHGNIRAAPAAKLKKGRGEKPVGSGGKQERSGKGK